MTNPEKLDVEAATLLDAPRSLRERAADYLAGLVIGFAAIAVLGAVISLFGAPVRFAIGHTGIAVGVFLIAAGGASGAGLVSLGIGEGIGRMVSHANPTFLLETDGSDPPVGRSSMKYGVVLEPTDRQDLIGRLRRGLRPERNPAAFWTVVAGMAYTALGLVLALI